MKRRIFLKASTLSYITLFACNKKQTDKYTHYLEPEVGKETILEGEIIHVCPIEWIENRWKDGSAERLLERNNENLQQRMYETKLNYVQIFSITANQIVEA
ncbi:MAG: hypothetical protein LBS04_01655 [Tannerellaceae bacterium]|jgi:hypothetical protein|nr:hypothetical protein [Tannerellaceae bacterium]